MLFEIIENKKQQVGAIKQVQSLQMLEQSTYFNSTCLSLKAYLQRPDKTGIIAEFKRKSPSKGVLNATADVAKTTMGYAQGGASALSVLTEIDYFMGNDDDLTTARKANDIPILRKDFVIDEYQIIEAKALGADAVLLIAAALEKTQIAHFTQVAKSIGLEVLFEIHTIEELKKLPSQEVIIGVNNRNLSTFVVDIQTSYDIAAVLSHEYVLVSESGLSKVNDLVELKKVGYTGFLMGEIFMKTKDPVLAFQTFVKNLAEATR